MPSSPEKRPLVAVVSPFLDKFHGTERITIEWLSNLPELFDIHVYSQYVEGLDLSRFKWHRVPKIPGPHLFNFLWWIMANQVSRAWDRRFRRLKYELVFSPGINCFDADVIAVQIIFAEFVRRAHGDLRFTRNPVSSWPRLIHRKLYYGVVMLMEKLLYPNPKTQLVLYARKTAEDLGHLYQRHEQLPVLYLGIDHDIFNTELRASLRTSVRKELGISEKEFALLLIGNDLVKKGLPTLTAALLSLQELPLRLLVVSREKPATYRALVQRLGKRVRFLPLRRDVEFYYAAADVYVGPSLEDTFSMPPAEAMACGLPVIVSSTAGVSEIVTDGVDGLILQDARDSAGLAAMIRHIYEDQEFRNRLGERAAESTRQYTWERNGKELGAIFQEVLRRKSNMAAEARTQES